MIRFDWIEKWADYSPSKIAVKEYETNRTLTYAELNRVANFLATKFSHELDIQPKDRIVVLAENSIEHIVLFSICQKIGTILVPLNYRLAQRELDYQIQNSDPSIIIIEEKFEEKIKGLESIKKVKKIISLKELSRIIEEEKSFEHKVSVKVYINEDDPIFILYTSGTTGLPKGALYTHRMLVWNSFNTSMRLDLTSEDRSVSCTPMFHTGGWNVIPTPFLHRGAYV